MTTYPYNTVRCTARWPDPNDHPGDHPTGHLCGYGVQTFKLTKDLYFTTGRDVSEWKCPGCIEKNKQIVDEADKVARTAELLKTTRMGYLSRMKKQKSFVYELATAMADAPSQYQKARLCVHEIAQTLAVSTLGNDIIAPIRDLIEKMNLSGEKSDDADRLFPDVVRVKLIEMCEQHGFIGTYY